jgi:hypothetical protein
MFSRVGVSVGVAVGHVEHRHALGSGVVDEIQAAGNRA